MTQPPSFEIGISEFTTNPWSFEQDVDHYARHGADTIEVVEAKLTRDHMHDQLQLPKENGLRISSIQPEVRTLFPSQSQPTPTEVPKRMERFRRTIEDFGVYGEGVPFVTNTGIPPDGNIQEVLDVAATEYYALAEFAGDFGASIAIEPLNPSIMNIESAIWTLEQASTLVDAVNRPNFGICLDFWNIWQNPSVEEAILSIGDRILVVQLADWRVPRSTQDRLVPGDGVIPLAPLIRATRDAGFTGAYSVEIFSNNVADALWESDLDDVLDRSVAGLRAAWEASFEL